MTEQNKIALNNELTVEKTHYSAGYCSQLHSHRLGQLIYPSKGTLILNTSLGRWIIPPQRACWLPANFLHKVRTRSYMEMHSVYVGETGLIDLPHQGRLLQVPPLMRQVILWLESNVNKDPAWQRVGEVFLDQICNEENALLNNTILALPSLAGTDLSVIEEALEDDPSLQRSLDEWGAIIGKSRRTLARRFEQIAAMNFSAYCLQIRLQCAIELLADKRSVTQIAYQLNFPSASAFIRIFRQHTGKTPGRYFNQL